LTTTTEQDIVIDAEQVVLGACLSVPYIVDHIRAVIPTPDAFYRPAHRIIYRAILDLYDADNPTDPIAVADHLQHAGTLGQAGGALYLHDLMRAAPIAGDPAHHARIVMRSFHQRTGRYELQRALQELEADADDPASQLHAVAERLLKVSETLRANDRQDRFPSINWAQAFATDFTAIDWLPGRFLERGQQAALVGDGKVGKSIFTLYWVWCAVTGRSCLGDIRRAPINVLYLDRENSLRDIVTRLTAFGATPDDLEVLQQRLDYRPFPRFSGALNASDAAAAELLSIVSERPRDLVIFDTVSRYIAGSENDADTWLDLYRRIHEPLKGMGVASLRLDHFGKDAEKGSRGSSAKTQDVDHVWELTAYDETRSWAGTVETVITRLKLARTHTRTGLGEDVFHITRRGEKERGGGWLPGRTRHELTDSTVADEHRQRIQAYVRDLVMAGVPQGLGREGLKRWARENGVSLPGRTEAVAEIAAALKAVHKSFEKGV